MSPLLHLPENPPFTIARLVLVTEKNFIVSYGPSANLVQIPVASLEPDETSMIEVPYITGSHIYNWSREMSEMFYPGPLV